MLLSRSPEAIRSTTKKVGPMRVVASALDQHHQETKI
jgi:hypothetical protein